MSSSRLRALRRGGPIAFVIASVMVWSVSGTFAHDGAAPLTVEPGLVNPGGTVVLKTADAGADAEIAFVLVTGAGPIQLGSAIADGEGHLSLAVRVPADLSSGTYEISATSAGVPFAEAAVVIDGPAIAQGEDPGAPRDREEPLLAPGPSDAPVRGSENAVPSVIDTAPSDDAVPGGGAVAPAGSLAVIAGLAVLVASGLLVINRRRR